MYVNNYEFYGLYDDFHFEHVLQNLKEILHPFITDGTPIRIWGLLEWRDEPGIREKLHTYECSCDITVGELGFLTICAYDAKTVSASIQLDMMRSHEYLMTDQQIVRSNLYEKTCAKTTYSFPSLSTQASMESELDLYKQKLDFVHVVSHEVRNPLTIIQAYASLLIHTETNSDRLHKLRAIVDYAHVIDYEISHIIATEQMLATEAIWQKGIINPRQILDSVLEIMEIKARTQNIQIIREIGLPISSSSLSNKMSLKLIFSNIISNAIKYSHEGSVIIVACHAKGHSLEFVVTDYGVGMTKEQVALLYRKYEKLNDERGGQGIGLFMVKTLIDQMNGTIRIHSRLEHGTKVSIRLPLL